MYTYLVCKEKVITELTYSFKPKTAFSKMRLRVAVQSSDRRCNPIQELHRKLIPQLSGVRWWVPGASSPAPTTALAEFCCNRIFITFLVSMSFKRKVRNQHLNLIGNSHIDQNWCFNLFCIKLKWQPMFTSKYINKILIYLFFAKKMPCKISEWRLPAFKCLPLNQRVC